MSTEVLEGVGTLEELLLLGEPDEERICELKWLAIGATVGPTPCKNRARWWMMSNCTCFSPLACCSDHRDQMIGWLGKRYRIECEKCGQTVTIRMEPM